MKLLIAIIIFLLCIFGLSCCLFNIATACYGQEFITVPGYTAGMNLEHELTHDVNSIVRNMYGGRVAVQGMWDSPAGKAIVVKSPPPGITLNDVANSIPKNERGATTFNLYMISQQQWEKPYPLYPLDELAAYTNGTEYYLSQGKIYDAKQSLNNADELYCYSWYAWQKVRTIPGYDDKQLQAALTYYYNRLDTIRHKIK